MITLDERGKQCPLPVLDAKKTMESCEPGELVEVLVDNEIAVQNLKKLASQKGYLAESEKRGDREFAVRLSRIAELSGQEEAGETGISEKEEIGEAGNFEQEAAGETDMSDEELSCQSDSREKGLLVVLSSNEMGSGDPALGKLLMKGFVYALTQQDRLPETVLLYNGGAYLSCEGSDSLEDLRELAAMGTEILTCGTCLNHYGLGEKLAVGEVTNMYEIVERMTRARRVVRP